MHLARAARELGAAAASSFGAGLGGSVWALVADGAADALQERWRADYLSRFPQHAGAAEFFQTRSGPPMARVLRAVPSPAGGGGRRGDDIPQAEDEQR